MLLGGAPFFFGGVGNLRMIFLLSLTEGTYLCYNSEPMFGDPLMTLIFLKLLRTSERMLYAVLYLAYECWGPILGSRYGASNAPVTPLSWRAP